MTRAKRVGAGILALLFVALAVRLTWVVATTETGADMECLRLAAEAVHRNPDNLEWRRMQALLQFASPLHSTGGASSRSDNWREVLDAGAAVDPENALYDYLAALELWRTSANCDYDATLDGYVLTIHNAEIFEEGVRRFERGLQKRCLQFGERGLSTVAEFLDTTPLTHADQADVAAYRLLTFRATGFPRDLVRWQVARHAEGERAGDVTAAAAQWWIRLKLTEQTQAGDEIFAFSDVLPLMRSSAAKQLLELDDKHPDLLTDAGRDELQRTQVAADARLELLKAASSRWPGATSPTPIAVTRAGFLAVIALRIAVICAFAALAGFILLRLRKSTEMNIGTRFGLWRHAVAWLVGYGLTWSVAQLLPDRSGWKSETMRSALSLAADSWQWRAIRWTSYYGYYAAIALALTTILLLSLLMYLWREDWPRVKGELARCVIRRCVVSLTAVAALWLVVSLAVTPALIHIAEQDFHSKFDYFRDVPAWLEKVKHTVEEVAAEQRQPPP